MISRAEKEQLFIADLIKVCPASVFMAEYIKYICVGVEATVDN